MNDSIFPDIVGNDHIYLEDTDASLPKSVVNTDMRYTNFKVLEKGGKCVIQTCKDNYLGRVVCHKSLRKEFINNKKEEKRFLREARVTAMLQHPNTIPIYEINRNNKGQYFFTMKLVEGLSLDKILKGLKENNEDMVQEFKLDRLLGAFIQVGNALSFAHSHGVVHRDIKPANIVIGPFGEVWLLDWGLAKVWSKDKSADDELEQSFGFTNSGDGNINKDFALTGHGKIEATPLYMSPEQIIDSAKIDFRTDIYNFGALFYEILCLEPMAWGNTLNELFEHTKHDMPPLPSEKNPDRYIPSELEAIAMKCAAKDPKDRYEDIAEVVKEVREFREKKYIDQ